MTSYIPPKKATELIFYLGLPSAGTSGTFQINPTLAVGDVKVSKDGGALANITTLPTVEPASSKMVKVTLSASEMDADNIAVVFSDQTATDEWQETIVNIHTAENQIDDLLRLDSTVEGTHTIAQFIRLMGSVLLGKLSGGGTGTEVFRDIDDTKDRVTATVDQDGNRTAITLDED